LVKKKNVINLHNKIIVVTGASSGLGFQIAKSLSKYDSKVIVCSRNTKKIRSKFLSKKNVILKKNTLYVDLSSSVLREELSYGKKKIIQIYKGIKPELKINHLNRVAAELFEIDITSKGIKKLMLQSSIDGGKIWNNEQMITPESTKEEELLLKIKQRSSSMIYRVIAPN